MPRSAVVILVLVTSFATRGAVHAGSTTCEVAKRTATGRLAQQLLACHAKATKKGTVAATSCVEKARASFLLAFAKAEAKADCGAFGDAAVVGVEVDEFVASTLTMLRPVESASKGTAAKIAGTGVFLGSLLSQKLKGAEAGEARLLAAFAKADAKQAPHTSGDGPSFAIATRTAGWTLGQYHYCIFDCDDERLGVEPCNPTSPRCALDVNNDFCKSGQVPPGCRVGGFAGSCTDKDCCVPGRSCGDSSCQGICNGGEGGLRCRDCDCPSGNACTPTSTVPPTTTIPPTTTTLPPSENYCLCSFGFCSYDESCPWGPGCTGGGPNWCVGPRMATGESAEDCCERAARCGHDHPGGGCNYRVYRCPESEPGLANICVGSDCETTYARCDQ